MLAVCSISPIGFGMCAAVMPLLSPEKGQQVAMIFASVLLLISGVYYPISVLPGWMQPAARISPATYVLDGLRDALLANKPIWSPEIWASTWPLVISGIVSVPLGMAVFRIAEKYAKRTGRLKRNG